MDRSSVRFLLVGRELSLLMLILMTSCFCCSGVLVSQIESLVANEMFERWSLSNISG